MSIKQKVKNFLLNNDMTKKMYDNYHEHAKYIYQIGKPKCVLHEGVIMDVFEDQKQTFFGYYDKSPLRNGHYIYHSLNSSSLSLNQEVDIYLDHQKIGSSRSWNWQQGAMLSWLDDESIIYNDFINNQYCSVIRDINTNQQRCIDYPIYKVSYDGKFALSLNFSRLAKLRPDYGYFNLPYSDITKNDDKDGIFYVDLMKNKCDLLVSLEKIAAIDTIDSMMDAYHEVNHIDLSPDQKRITFLHRWYDNANTRNSRLIMFDLTTSKLTVLVNEGMVSHCTWKNEKDIVGYLRHDNKDYYYQIDTKTMKIELLDDQAIFSDDGHPSFSFEQRYMITDTYPDHTCSSKLYLYDDINKSVVKLGSFYSPKRFQGVSRCDLHPRWAKKSHEITIDTVYSGNRRMCKLDLRNVIEGK
ncbi:MAG: hypothetical protein RBT45_08240 [Acholeplasmataceae bacterium]|jgi:hypothetical protein|nr:hypothetical protein [Acholeplasmataceae bacterium]